MMIASESGIGLDWREWTNGSLILVDRAGSIRGWTVPFSMGPRGSQEGVINTAITGWLPELDAERWTRVWDKICAGGVERFCITRAAMPTGRPHLVEIAVRRIVHDGENLASIEMRRVVAEIPSGRLGTLQQEILEVVASGVPLRVVMDLLCHRVEAMAPGVICSVLRVDHDGRLLHLASPSLPEEYARAVDGMVIGPCAGSCGTAAHRGEAVVVTDIATDPLWAQFKSLALPLGLRACWSSPIKSGDGRIIGAFAFYFPTQRGPTTLEREIVATCIHLCAIAIEHDAARTRIYELAFHDTLTGLSNRAGFQRRLADALQVAAEGGRLLAVYHIDIDHFMAINDTLGHAVGDDLLKAVAERIRSMAKEADTVARMGGDEFALVQIGTTKVEDIAQRARELLDLLRSPYDIGAHRIVLESSIGIAVAPHDGDSAELLAKNADLALHRAKELGRGAYTFYEKELNARMQQRRTLEAELRKALTDKEFELHYQPLIDLKRGRITSAEALIRWHSPKRGLVSPAEFIPMAEDVGLIVPLGEWALREACATAATWPGHVRVAVNLSPVQFKRPGLVKLVADVLAASGLAPNRLELEITESVLLDDNEANLETLNRLRELGVSIALDDFGTGYSSLSYLQKFSFDKIKIDSSFIRDITSKNGSIKIVRAIVMLARSLGIRTTAEGVETQEQYEAVRHEGCDEMQGYYMSRPRPAREMSHFFAASQPAVPLAQKRPARRTRKA